MNNKFLEQFNKLKTWYVLKMAEGNEHLLRGDEKEMFNTIEKALNALELAIRKRVDFDEEIYCPDTYADYLYVIKEQKEVRDNEFILTEQEFNLIRKVAADLCFYY